MIIAIQNTHAVFISEFIAFTAPFLAVIRDTSVSRITANSQQPTANSQQPTANSQQPTANSQQLKN